MEFKRRIKPVEETKSYPYLAAKNIWLYLVILFLLATNSLVTVGAIEYLSTQKQKKKLDRIANNYVQNISDRLLISLNNFAETKNIDSENREIELENRTLDKYLSEINTGVSTKVTIVDRDGSIVASNLAESSQKSALTSQSIISNLQKKLGTLSNLEKSRRLNLKVNKQDLSTQVIPWENPQLERKRLVIVAVPKSALLADIAAEQDDLLAKYSAYLLPTIISGLLTYLGIMFLVHKLNQSKTDNSTLAGRLASETKTKEKQILAAEQIFLSNSQSDLERKQPYMLLANMSHELRSPLNAILGFAQIMEQESSTTQADLEHITMISRSGDRLLAIVNDVVDLAKIEIDKLTLEQNNIDFHDWLDNIEQSFKFQAHSQGWDFTLIKQSDLPEYICIDERRLRQIIRNIINYCLKKDSSTNVILAVSSGCAIPKTTETNLSTSNERHNISFEFKNPDFSATATELATLFDPMTRVDRGREDIEGSSLNLPISRKLSQLMGGDIVVKDNGVAESGITFNLEIQTESIAAQKVKIQSTVRRIVGLEPGQTEYRILVVDDSKTNRKIMSQILESVGFQVREAVNGSEAIDVWLHWQPHMIWMDLRMPVMNGYEATERIKSSSPNVHIPIVALSATTLEEEKALFRAAGCDDFVGKPFSKNIIFDKIAQHLGIRYVYESAIPLSSNNFKLTPSSLNVMPNKWLNRLEQAAIELDRDLLTQLLQEIPLEHIDLKNALQKQINNFDFDRIVDLTKNSQNN